MGCSLAALLKILAAGRFSIAARYWPECVVDLTFAAFNSALGIGQHLAFDHTVAHTPLADDPIFIVGHWRTGTTLLHELLSLDARLRAPTNYECLAPNHFLLTGRWLRRWTGFTLPQTRPPDQMRVTWDSPQEDEFALCNLGVPSPYATIAFPNQGTLNDSYFELDSLTQSEQKRWQQTLLRFFQQLTYARPGRLVLKSPTHTFRLPMLTRMFSRAAFINIVRNPFDVFSSSVRLWRSLYAAYGYQKPTFAGLEEHVLRTFARMHERLEATRGQVATGSLIDVRYEDLVRLPEATLERIYQELKLGDFGLVQPALDKYLADRAGYTPNRHSIDLHWADQIRQHWRPYFERYGYSLEDGSVRG